MGYFQVWVHEGRRDNDSIYTRTYLTPDDYGQYKIEMTRSGSSTVYKLQLAQYGDEDREYWLNADETVYAEQVLSDLSANTNYTVTAQLYAKDRWEGDDNWFQGVSDTRTIMTYPDPVTNLSASLNSDQTTLTVSWYQSYGGGASTITNQVEYGLGVSGYYYPPTVLDSEIITVSSSGSKSCTFDVSGLSNGAYSLVVWSRNVATNYDQNEFNSARGIRTTGDYVISDSCDFIINRQAAISGSITTSNATPSGTTADISFSFNNDSSTSYSMYYVIGVGTNSSSSASSYTYTHQSSATTKSTGTSTYSYTMPESGSQLTPGTLYYYRIEVYGKGSSDSSYTLLDSDTGSFTTTASAAAGTWSSGPTVTVSGSTINYSATWRQSSSGSTSWTFSVYLDDANASGRQYNQTATLTQNGTHNISGSIQNASEGEHRIYFNAKATGKDEWAYRDVAITPSGAPTGSWTTSPSVTQTSGAMTAKCSAVVKRNDSISQSYYVRIRVINASNDSAVTTSSATSINQTGSVTLDYTTSALSSGAYTYSFIAEYSSSSSGPWTQLYTSSGSALYNDVTFAISDSSTPSTTPSGTWTAVPSVVQTENAMTATCSAVIKRNDSVANQYYVRIHVQDSSGNDVVANTGTRIANTGSVSLSSTTGTLSAGTHSYTFTPEWRSSTSDAWAELRSSSSNSLVRTATVTITDSGSPDPTPEPSGQTLYKWAWGTGTFFSQITPESTTSQRQQAYSALTSGTTNQRATTNFNHTVWNDLITWITWSLDQLNVTYTASVASNAKMQSSPYTLTAAKWNSMRTLWNTLLTTGLGGSSSDQLSSVQSGDTVYGSMFTSLVSVMNNYIDDYNS